MPLQDFILNTFRYVVTLSKSKKLNNFNKKAQSGFFLFKNKKATAQVRLLLNFVITVKYLCVIINKY